MKIATQTHAFAQRFGEVRAVELLAEIGYDALDLSLGDPQSRSGLLQAGFEKQVQHLQDTAKACGIVFNQSHAPFPAHKEGDDTYNRYIFEKICHVLRVSGMLGIKTVVVHPFMANTDTKDKNIAFYEGFIPLCAEYGLKVALENLFMRGQKGGYTAGACGRAETFTELLDALDPRYFTACLDIGHAGIAGETAAAMIRMLGHDRLTALHVHDNDLMTDQHLMPFLGKVNWEAVTRALKDIRYTGDLTFEADGMLLKLPREMYCDASRLMLSCGRHLVDMIGL